MRQFRRAHSSTVAICTNEKEKQQHSKRALVGRARLADTLYPADEFHIFQNSRLEHVYAKEHGANGLGQYIYMCIYIYACIYVHTYVFLLHVTYVCPKSMQPFSKSTVHNKKKTSFVPTAMTAFI